MAEEFGWAGYERGSRSKWSGYIRCEWCGEQWNVPKCWLAKLSPGCRAVLERHRRTCQESAGATITESAG